MRSRRTASGAAEGPVGDAAANAPHRLRSPSPPSASSSLLHSASLFGARKESDSSNADVCDAYAIRLRNEAVDAVRYRRSYWHVHCSPSILVALLIWVTIGLVVYTKLDSFHLRNGAAPTTSSAETVHSQLPDGCLDHHCLKDGGSELFGAVLGAHNGVFAYSNCNSNTCISHLEHQMEIPLPPGSRTTLDAPHATTRLMKTGMKWQCVEYARRYWMLHGKPTPALFGTVVGAADIWHSIHSVTLLDNKTTAPLLKFQNGAKLGYGGNAPRVGDLLIYPRDTLGNFPFGHVAVVVGVEMPANAEANDSYTDAEMAAAQLRQRRGLVYIAEQNWDSVPWPKPYHNYSRSLPLVVLESPEGQPLQYTIEDSFHGVQGWARYDDVP
ncbi:D-alanyl-glycyl endopeptidase-like protein [Leishmania panamensis]|uniref:D-alanyl-glycyl endopeptidase-like protein, putative n=2 Tax=Leishmania guyanensis species complex TaxID=38579 RepID=A0A088RZL1_LEIPA|nr:D-alanyl-glycyl endopeptidase-like protein [Leishmania panamensis]AIO01588.1 D-alanyl-glycyl endopeptidase-like protein [Leishmania panamensis]